MSLKCPVASKVAEPSLLFDRPCWPDQHAIPSPGLHGHLLYFIGLVYMFLCYYACGLQFSPWSGDFSFLPINVGIEGF
jgi:hypothetical protein